MGPQQDETGATRRDRPLGEPWLLGACACVVAAAACLVLGFYDAAFVIAALGAVAWFLNVRGKLPRTPGDEEDEGDTPEDDEAADSDGATTGRELRRD